MTRLRTFLCLLGLTGFLGACGDDFNWNWFGKGDKEKSAEKPAAVEPRTDLPSFNPESDSYRDTVRSLCWVKGSRRMRVQGYGLIVGLGKNGTKQCPEPVRKVLMQEIRKRRAERSSIVRLDAIPEDKLINSEDTAVVLVQGEIPSYAVKGYRFDAFVSGLSGTEVKSLEGGRLYTVELRPVVTTGGRDQSEGAGTG